MNFDRFYSEREEKLAELKKKISLAEADDKRMVEIKLIEENEEHTIRIRYSYEDNPDTVYDKVVCPICSGINGHFPDCIEKSRIYEKKYQNTDISLRSGTDNDDNGEKSIQPNLSQIVDVKDIT